MKIQTYAVVADVETFEPVNIGQIVYGWPYADWGLGGPDDVLICLTLQHVATIYAVPRQCLTPAAIIDASIHVAAKKGSPQPEEDARMQAGVVYRIGTPRETDPTHQVA